MDFDSSGNAVLEDSLRLVFIYIALGHAPPLIQPDRAHEKGGEYVWILGLI